MTTTQTPTSPGLSVGHVVAIIAAVVVVVVSVVVVVVLCWKRMVSSCAHLFQRRLLFELKGNTQNSRFSKQVFAQS